MRTNFVLECDMSESVRRWLRRQGFSVKSEFVLPWGICDLVGVQFDRSHVDKRVELGQGRPIGPLSRVDLLRHIPECESGEAITLRELQRSCAASFPKSTLEHELQFLIHGRFVIGSGTGSFQKVNGWEPLHKRIVAVELKLSRISEALGQAAAHRMFATDCYVALPVETARQIVDSSRVSTFQDRGVGLLAVTPTRCTVLLPSSINSDEVDPVLQMHCVERFWRTRDSSS